MIKFLKPETLPEELNHYAIAWHSYKTQGQFADPRSGKLFSVFEERSRLDAGIDNYVVLSPEALDAAVQHLDTVANSDIVAHDRFGHRRKENASCLHDTFSKEARDLQEAISKNTPVNPFSNPSYILTYGNLGL